MLRILLSSGVVMHAVDNVEVRKTKNEDDKDKVKSARMTMMRQRRSADEEEQQVNRCEESIQVQVKRKITQKKKPTIKNHKIST